MQKLFGLVHPWSSLIIVHLVKANSAATLPEILGRVTEWQSQQSDRASRAGRVAEWQSFISNSARTLPAEWQSDRVGRVLMMPGWSTIILNDDSENISDQVVHDFNKIFNLKRKKIVVFIVPICLLAVVKWSRCQLRQLEHSNQRSLVNQRSVHELNSEFSLLDFLYL